MRYCNENIYSHSCRSLQHLYCVIASKPGYVSWLSLLYTMWVANLKLFNWSRWDKVGTVNNRTLIQITLLKCVGKQLSIRTCWIFKLPSYYYNLDFYCNYKSVKATCMLVICTTRWRGTFSRTETVRKRR